jgi:hypothetical protein
MIDKYTIDIMTEMLALISKYSKGAHPKVETAASCENRRRAWSITKMLARLAGHAAESDFYLLLSNNVQRTNADRNRCYQIAAQEQDAFTEELRNFRKRASEFELAPATAKDRTDHDIVRELEHLLPQVQVLQMKANLTVAACEKLSAKERKLMEANPCVDAVHLARMKSRLEAAEKLALSRGMVVSFNRTRTVIKRVETPDVEPSVATAKAEKVPMLKLVATKPAPTAKTRTVLAKKSA